MIVLVDEHGVRHEIDVDPERGAYASVCDQWMVTDVDKDRTGHARRCVPFNTREPLYELGRHGPVGYIARRSVVEFSDSDTPFGPSDDPITCIECITALRGLGAT